MFPNVPYRRCNGDLRTYTGRNRVTIYTSNTSGVLSVINYMLWILLVLKPEYCGKTGQYHVGLCPSSLCHQATSRHGIEDQVVLVFREGGFQMLALSPCWNMIECSNPPPHFIKWIQDRGYRVISVSSQIWIRISWPIITRWNTSITKINSLRPSDAYMHK